MQKSVDILAKFDIPYEVLVVSAHRTPDRLFEYAADARARGFEYYCRSWWGCSLTRNVGIKECRTSFWRAGGNKLFEWSRLLFSIVQMPKGVPVATFAIGTLVPLTQL